MYLHFTLISSDFGTSINHISRENRFELKIEYLLLSKRSIITVFQKVPIKNINLAGRDIETEKPSQLTRKENADFRTSKKKNEKIWILKTLYGKHSIYFSDF